MFRFASPEYLYFLSAIPFFILLYVIYRLSTKKRLGKLVDKELQPLVIPKYSSKKQITGMFFSMLGLTLITIALARPQFGTKLEEIKAEGSDIIVAIDVSNSMLAEDLPPNRLERAQNSVEKLIAELRGDRIGLVVFAGKSFLQLPLTTDYSAARLMLSTLSPELVSTQGTAIGAAIETAVEAFSEEEAAGRTIVVITDGENHEDNAIAAAEEAAEKGITIHTIGMGRPEGAPIPIPGKDNSYIKDDEGNTVVTKLDENALKQIASVADGSFVRVSGGTPDLATIIADVDEKDKVEFGKKQFTEFEDQYQIPLLLGFLFLLFEPITSNIRGNFSNLISDITEKGV